MGIKIKVFSTPDCSTCKPLKNALDSKGVDYISVDCSEPDAFKDMRKYGIRGVPTTVVETEEGLVIGSVVGNKIGEILEIINSSK